LVKSNQNGGNNIMSTTGVIILIGVSVLMSLLCIIGLISEYKREQWSKREYAKHIQLEERLWEAKLAYLKKCKGNIEKMMSMINNDGGSTMIIVDVDREGCRIWHNGMGAYVRGSIAECCEELIHRICIWQDGHLRQIYQIGMDKSGISTAVADYLENKGIEVLPIKFEHINNFLPRLW
jgi:hypothetical protein